MHMNLLYPWPAPPGFPQPPRWTGGGFDMDGRHLNVLQYGAADSNWSDELTELHEETAGENHFIDVASRRHAIEQFRKHVQVQQPILLEVGCSSGFLLKQFRREMPEALLIGSDFIAGPLEQLATQLRDVPLLKFDVTKCPLPDASLDAVILLNVLEHVEDDLAAARQAWRILKPGGVAIIEVPAGPQLYDVYDKCLMHWRRYSLGQLCATLREAGFEVVEQSHLGFFLYPGFWWVKKSNRRHLAADLKTQRSVVARRIQSTGQSRLLHALMRFELWLGRWLRFPMGIRCLVTCRKPMAAAAGAAPF